MLEVLYKDKPAPLYMYSIFNDYTIKVSHDDLTIICDNNYTIQSIYKVNIICNDFCNIKVFGEHSVIECNNLCNIQCCNYCNVYANEACIINCASFCNITSGFGSMINAGCNCVIYTDAYCMIKAYTNNIISLNDDSCIGTASYIQCSINNIIINNTNKDYMCYYDKPRITKKQFIYTTRSLRLPNHVKIDASIKLLNLKQQSTSKFIKVFSNVDT